MREPYICQYCDHRSTRWWNLKIHMKRKHGDYSLDRSSAQYTLNNPTLYNKNVQPGHATVADSVGDGFQSRYIPQQTHIGTSQYSASPIHRSLPTMDDQSYGTGLSQDTLLKIERLKRLLNKYPQYFTNPNQILTWTIHWAVNGDNKILDENLEQLRYIDNLAKY
jgi:hypothetical protein